MKGVPAQDWDFLAEASLYLSSQRSCSVTRFSLTLQ
jgi:hypothetical protein